MRDGNLPSAPPMLNRAAKTVGNSQYLPQIQAIQAFPRTLRHLIFVYPMVLKEQIPRPNEVRWFRPRQRGRLKQSPCQNERSRPSSGISFALVMIA
jgi:hypothetical protein